MNRVNLFLLLFLSSVAFAQEEWVIEEFTPHKGNVFLSTSGTAAVGHRLLHVFNPVADTIGHPVFRTDIVELVYPGIPLTLVARSGEVVTLTISEGSPHYAYFDMPIEIFPVIGLHQSISKAHDLCKRRLGAEREPIQLLLVFPGPWHLALANV
jgi:hypothetical protein